jgi:hypothetical protein
VDKLLVLDPTLRYTAEQALDHDYLWVEHPVEPSRCVECGERPGEGGGGGGGGLVGWMLKGEGRVTDGRRTLVHSMFHTRIHAYTHSLPKLTLRKGGR